ncbi:MAG: hypothetical protein Q7R45_15880, partial [Sulfuricaulis sp.]|nr:hypothetical protein [Sulfuricaulis sp.]
MSARCPQAPNLRGCKDHLFLWPWQNTKRCLFCGAFNELKVGQNTITTCPAGVGDLFRWSATKAAVAAGDLGMNQTTGRPSAYVGAARDLAYTAELGSTLIETITVAGAAVASVTFSGLTGDTAKQYLLVSRVVCADATQVQVLLNAAATTYGTVVWSVNSTPASSVINTYTTPAIADSANADIVNALTIIGAEKDTERVIAGFSGIDRPGGIVIKWDLS